MEKQPIILIKQGIFEFNGHQLKYEFFSNKVDVIVNIFHPSLKNGSTQFIRNDKLRLKDDMENALYRDGFPEEIDVSQD